jgi:hypothetical protein
MTISRATVISSMTDAIARRPVVFHFALERSEALVPEAIEERQELLESLRPRPIEAPRAGSALAHQAGLLEDAEVLGDRGP